MALDPSFEEQQLVEAAMERRGTPLRARERRAEALLGGELRAGLPPAAARRARRGSAAIDPAAALCCALALAVAVRVHFVVGQGYTVPTQLAFVPMTFAVPPALLAPAVACVFAAAQLVDVARGRLPLSRLAPRAEQRVVRARPRRGAGGGGVARGAEATVALVARMVAAQVALDAAMSCLRDALHDDLDLRAHLSEAWLYAVDVALTPIGLRRRAGAADGTRGRRFAIVPLLGVLAVFAREREARMQGLAELNAAYRGTALVLGDVVEADDGYTGEHCRDVVDLARRGRPAAGAAGRPAPQPRVRRAAARRRQGRDPEGDHQQARPAR